MRLITFWITHPCLNVQLAVTHRWAAKQGVDERAASRFVAAMFHSLADNWGKIE